MSVSSGSDVTIPIQDSPPPPPSPYANRTDGQRTPEPSGDVTSTTGIENKGYQPEGESKSNGKKKSKNGECSSGEKKGHTEINMGNGNDAKLNEAVNSELINMNIMNTIPAKPQSEFGPYEQMDDYFIPVNQHKKFLSRRSEKLYVTKDKRKGSNLRKYLCWTVIAFILAGIVAVAILAAVGIIPQPTSASYGQIEVTTTASPFSAGVSSTTAAPWRTSETSKPPVFVPTIINQTYVPNVAELNFDIKNRDFSAALNNKSSESFQLLAKEIHDEMKMMLKTKANLTSIQTRVERFLPGSVAVKVFLGWMDDTVNVDEMKQILSNVRELGPFSLSPISSYGVVNKCNLNVNGCSHICTYDYESLDFLCTCPEMMLLGDDQKTCKNGTAGADESLVEPEPSAAVPEAEVPASPESSPETPVEPESSSKPEIEPETVSEDTTSPPEIEELPSSSSTTSSTTPEPRQEDLDLPRDGEEMEEESQTTIAPIAVEPSQEPITEEKEHSVVESPSETESRIGNDYSTSSTTSTTEAPIVPAVIDPETHQESEHIIPVESIPSETSPKSSEEETVAVTDAPVVSNGEGGSDAQVVPEVSEETTQKASEESVGGIISPQSESHESTAAIHHEHESQAEDILARGSTSTTTTSTTTTEAVPSTSSSTTETPAVIVDETHQGAIEPLTANLQQDGEEEIVQSGEKSGSSEVVLPTNQPTSQESESVPITSNNTSSERNGRDFSEQLQSSVEETTAQPNPTIASGESGQQQNRPQAIPNSGEFMVYSDLQPAHSSSQQTSSTESTAAANNKKSSNENSGSTSDEQETAANAASEDLQGSVEAEEITTTTRPRTFIGDTDVNQLETATEDTVHSEQVQSNPVDGRDIAAIQDEVLGEETTQISEEQDEPLPPNRDHLKAAEVDTTLSSVVFDEEEEHVTSTSTSTTTEIPSSTSTTTTTTTPSPIVETSTPAPTIKIISTASAENSSNNNEGESSNHLSENELS